MYKGYTTVHVEVLKEYQSNFFRLFYHRQIFFVLETYDDRVNYFLYVSEFFPLQIHIFK